MERDPLRTIDQAAEQLCTPEATLRFWRHKGIGPRSAKLGRRIVYRQSDLDAFVEAQFEAAKKDRDGRPTPAA
ncbi:helix-turn-helix domain-containing protein [Nocardioides panacisoli]|uniref:Helix-turn-helix domain-containing protein n=1 Tax=Nocardioides panacisoli TaxID=627624 RepID=A0ABP7I5Q2_9ACTN